jgi:hypothetical protein
MKTSEICWVEWKYSTSQKVRISMVDVNRIEAIGASPNFNFFAYWG